MGEITRGEQNLIDDLNEFVRQTSDQLDEQETSTGIRPNPVIESTEQTLDTSRFGLGFAPQPLAEATPGEGGGITETYPPQGACCFGDGSCFVLSESECGTDGGTYQGDDTECVPNPCSTMPSCNGCGFDAFDGSGRKFLTMSVHYERPEAIGVDCCLDNPVCVVPGNICDEKFDCSGTAQYDEFCDYTETLSPGGHTIYICAGFPGIPCDTAIDDCDAIGACTDTCAVSATVSVCMSGGATCTKTLSDECTP